MHHHGCIPFSALLRKSYNERDESMTVNGEKITLEKPVTVSEYLASNGYRQARIAVEINEEIVPKSQYETRTLCESDRVEIVTFMGGG